VGRSGTAAPPLLIVDEVDAIDDPIASVDAPALPSHGFCLGCDMIYILTKKNEFGLLYKCNHLLGRNFHEKIMEKYTT
jgi:hypothetical protein